ncbi:MAG: tetratricopeptide repeat protein [Candidatus Abyssobacteria bacterium SURF_5]|uniref:Tetratricopeptide repeat protein n=1 Tax=Abyssobacteria bacterium (strain SURF_5) TaxID=2093360 RepID=A0A3A4NPM2_ABYX5|nr:MAG: tetratricopeptide repeat protein [Candidatus Abyssubacteria bacterium SURF_5]
MHKIHWTLIFCLLAGAVSLVYMNSLTADFVYDDYAFICNNHAIRTLTPLSKFLFSPEAFSQPVSYHVFRPLASFSFALNYAAHGLEPAGFRAVNVLFHILNAFLLFLVLRRIGLAELPSVLGALVFAVHPVHTEAVTWISGRGNVLFLFFFLLSYLMYAGIDEAKGPGRWLLLAGAVGAYLLALLGKEMALPLPALLLGHDLYVHGRRELKRRLKLYLPFVAVAAAYLILRAEVLGRVGQVEYHGGSSYTTFLAMLRAAAVYMRLLFVPVELSLSRHFEPPQTFFDAGILFSLFLVTAVILMAYFLYRRVPLVSFGIYWFAAAMAPVSNIIPVNAIVADRFLYGPSIGFCIVAATAVQAAAGIPLRYRRLSVSAVVVLLFLLMTLAIRRNIDWRHPVLLWSKTAQLSPTSYVAWNNLALEYMKLGQAEESVEALQKALALRDDLPQTHVNLARCYSQLGRVTEAAVHYSIALDLMGDDPKIREELQALRRQHSAIPPPPRASSDLE